MLHHSGHDRPGRLGYAVNMLLSPCPQCAHALWSEVCCLEAFRCVLYFDDEHSDTYADRVRSCPECGVFLLDHALDPPELTAKPREQRVVVSRSPRSH